MRKLLLAALIAFIIIVPFASAKNILYVSQAYTYTPCSNLTSEDKLFCERLESLGYNVQVIKEEHTKAATSTWTDFLDTTDMIFIGDVSLDMVNTSKYQGEFCGNIFAAGKPVFASFASTLKNATRNLEGCAFSRLVSFAFDDNCFEKRTFRIEKIGYNTKGYIIGQTVDLYRSPVVVKVHDVIDSGWITAECTPDTPDTIDFYPVVNTSSKGVFWGLDKPSQFTSAGWDLFDRTVVFALGEKMWKISAFTIPENITKNQTFWLLAKILTRNGTEIKAGTVNISFGGNLLWNSGTGYWENRTMKIQADSSLSIEAENGNLTTSLKAGNITVNILSGNYFPGTNYTIEASSSQLAALSFKIRNSSDFTNLSVGNLAKADNAYSKTITTGGWGNFILEINAVNGILIGGTFGIINTTFVQEINIATDKLQYKPGEVVKVNLSSNVDITQANLTIIFPDNTSLDLGPMNKISSTYFNSTPYSLPYIQGTYTLSAKIKTDSEILERNKTIEVIVFKISPSLDKTTYRAGDIAKLMLEVLDLYNTPVNATYAVNLTDGTEEQVDLGVTGLDGYAEVFHVIRTDYLTGGYKFKIWVWDEWHNESKVFVEKSFNIIAAGTLAVLPASWSITEVGSYTKEFFINNTGSGNLTDIIVALSQSLQGLVTLNTTALLTRVGPYGNTSFSASINAQQNVNGTITVSYAEGTFPIQVSVTLQPIEGVLEIFPTSWSIITIADEKPQKEFSLRPNIDADRINITTDLKDIIQVIGYPSSIKAGEDGILTLKADTTGLEEGTKTGKVDISSSIGSAKLTVRIEILGDITSNVEQEKLELAELEKNITALKASGRNATELLSLYQEILGLLDDAKVSFEDEDYAQAKSKFSEAQSKISTLETKLNQAWAIPPPGIGSAIWTVAKIIIVLIVLVTAFIYRDKIKEFINKILKKKPPEKKEDYYPEYKEERERYRTGYY